MAAQELLHRVEEYLASIDISIKRPMIHIRAYASMDARKGLYTDRMAAVVGMNLKQLLQFNSVCASVKTLGLWKDTTVADDKICGRSSTYAYIWMFENVRD